jgi:hypothetical protein
LKVPKPGELATWRGERARAANVRRTEVTEEIKWRDAGLADRRRPAACSRLATPMRSNPPWR